MHVSALTMHVGFRRLPDADSLNPDLLELTEQRRARLPVHHAERFHLEIMLDGIDLSVVDTRSEMQLFVSLVWVNADGSRQKIDLIREWSRLCLAGVDDAVFGLLVVRFVSSGSAAVSRDRARTVSE